MSIDAMIALASLGIVLVVNLVTFTIHFTKISSRIAVCEARILRLEQKNSKHSDELKAIIKIEAQIELLISHIIPDKNG